MTGSIQQVNKELYDLLATEFVIAREQTQGWMNAVSLILNLPGLRGFWPGTILDGSGNCQDLGPNGLHLTRVNTVYGYENLLPYMEFAGAEEMTRTDEAAFDILGSEAYIAPALRGLTMGCWINADSIAGGVPWHYMTKYGSATTNRPYTLLIEDDDVSFAVTTSGSSEKSASILGEVAASSWFYTAGRFDPGSEVKVWLNESTATNVATIPIGLVNGTADFRLGRMEAGDFFEGKMALPWLSTMLLPDYMVDMVYQQTKSLFGR